MPLDKNSKVAQKTAAGAKTKLMNFVIDRIHIHNHKGSCHLDYNADIYEDLTKINTVVCEETNFWLSGYKYAAKHMNAERFIFFLYIILQTFNEKKIRLIKTLF
jgi:hypothetical protein